MFTLEEMGKKFIELYNDALKRVPYTKEELEDYFENISSRQCEEKDEEINLEIFNCMSEDIDCMDNEKFSNFVSLLSIYYYCKCHYDDDEYINEEDFEIDDWETDDIELDDFDEDEEDDIIGDMETITKEEFIDDIKDQNNNYLFDLLEVFFDEELFGLNHEDFSFDKYDCLSIVDEIDGNEKVENIFSKFHPNLKKEFEQYIDCAGQEQIFNKCTKFDVNSVSDFIQLYEIVRKKINDELLLKEFLRHFLINMNEKNEMLCNDILIFILKYYYVKSYFSNKKNLDDVMNNIYSCIFEINDINKHEDIIYEFSDFNFQEFCESFPNVPSDVVEVMKEKISLDNLKTYGTSGIWKEYNYLKEINQNKDAISRFCPSWYFKENNEDYKYIIYFSVDKKNQFNIPRLCIVVDSNNNAVEIYGKEANNNIEFEMLPILEEKIVSYSNKDYLLQQTNILKTFASIIKKIELDKELIKEEIDFLYNITRVRSRDNIIFNHAQYKINNILENLEHKKYLSKYYDCSEDQIALNYQCLTEESVALIGSLFVDYKCNYPNLKIIFGSAYCTDLKNAEGLCNLERVKGDADFYRLNDLSGLKNLIEVGRNLSLNSLESINGINPNLYVDGEIILANKKIKKK